MTLGLSVNQRGLWFIHQYSQIGTAYNEGGALWIEGALDVARLRQSLEALARRHFPLHCTFEHDGTSPRARRLEELPPLEVVESLRTLDDVREALTREFSRPFSFGQGPLAKFVVFRLSDLEHVLLLKFHHIIYDGWSNQLFLRELEQNYTRLAAGAPLESNADETYLDFVKEEADTILAHGHTSNLRYFADYLAGYSQTVLPLDHKRAAIKSERGGAIRVAVGKELLARFQRNDLTANFSPNVVFAAAYQVLLSRHCNQRDVIFGSPFFNRSAKYERTLGFFANMLPFRNQLDPREPLSSLLSRTRAIYGALQDRQSLPFPLLVNELGGERELSQNPIFQNVLAFQNVHQHEFGIEGLRIRSLELTKGISKFDLECYVWFDPAHTEVELVFDRDLFEPESITALGRHLLNILEQIGEGRDVALKELELFSAGELRQFDAWNATHVPASATRSLVELFSRRASAAPALPALHYLDRVVSYGELERLANQYANCFDDGTVQRRFIVFMERSPELIGTLLGLLKARCAYVPIDPAYPDEKIARIASELGVRDFVVSEKLLPRLGNVLELLPSRDQNRHVYVPDGQGLGKDALLPSGVAFRTAADFARCPSIRAVPEASRADEAYVIFTSGSTGAPKGVSVANGPVLNVLEWVNARYSVGPGDKLLFVASVAFDLSVYDIFGTLSAGASLRVVPDDELRDPEKLFRYVLEDGITFWDSAPASFQNVASLFGDRPGIVSRDLRLVFLSGDWVPLGLPAVVAEKLVNAKLVVLGGATEAAIWSNYYEVERVDPEWESIPYGYPIQNAQYHVLDDCLRRVPLGTPGDLYIGGECLANGYANDVELSAKKFILEPSLSLRKLYKTGDKAKRRRDGVLVFLGREDDQVKIRGYRVELGEVTTALSDVAGVEQCALVVDDSDRHLKSLHAFVVLEAPGASSESAIRGALGKSLPHYMVPSSIEVLTALPATANGKVDYKALKLRVLQRAEGALAQPEVSNVSPEILTVLQRNLRSASFALDKSFFAAGGNSIVGFRILRQLGERLGQPIPMTLLFEAASIRDFILSVERLQPESSVPVSAGEAQPAAHDGEQLDEAPLSDLQQAYWIGSSGAFFNPLVAHLVVVLDVPDLDPVRLQHAFQAVVDAHDALNAVVTSSGVLKRGARSLGLEQVDCSGGSLEQFSALSAERERWHREHGPRCDLAPMMQVEILRFRGFGRVFCNINLIVCDGMSVNLLFKQVFARYFAAPSVEPRLPTSAYFRYQQGLHDLKSSADYARHRDYWRAKLAQIPLAPTLPTRARPAQTGSASPLTRFSSTVSRARWDRFKRACAAQGASQDMAVLTLFSELLGTWSETPSFSLVIMYFNRLELQERVDELVGNFATTTLASFETCSGNAGSVTLQRNRAGFFRDLEHNLFTGVEVLQELSKLHGSNVLIPFSFASGLNLFDGDGGAGSWEPFVRRVHLQVPQIVLDHQIYEDRDGQLVVIWDVLEEHFASGVPAAMFEAYSALLERACDDDDFWQQPLLVALPAGQRERRRVVNATERALPQRWLHEGFLDSVRHHPARTAMVGDGVSFTYAQLDRVTTSLASFIRRQVGLEGVERRIAFTFARRWQQIVAAISILKLGCCYVPLVAGLPRERLKQIAANASLDLLLASEDLDLPCPFAKVQFELLADCPEATEVLDFARSSGASAYVIYTSGSTGVPKGVDISHAGAVNTIEDINRMLSASEEDAVLCLSSIGFDLSVYDVFGLLAVGGKLVLPDTGRELDAAHVLRLLSQHQVTIWNTVPEYMKIMAEHASSRGGGAHAIKNVLLSGDWIPLDLPDRIRQVFRPENIYSLGGATEASIWSIYHRIEAVDPAWRSIPYGKPLANQTWRVLSAAMQDCPDHVVGNLYIGGRGVAKGYLNDSERTAAAFVRLPGSDETLYRTGDKGCYLPDGSIELIGRDDNQVKINGIRIELGDIEAALQAHPHVKRAIVVAHGERFTGKQLCAFVVGQAIEQEELERHLSQRLPQQMCPRQFTFLDELPLSSNGKVDRGELQRRAGGSLANARPTVAPRGALEQELFQIYADVLGHSAFGVTHSFLGIGGTSFLAVRVLSRVRARYGRDVSLPSFLAQPSVEQLAKLVAEPAVRSASSQDVIWFSRGARPLLALFHPIGGSAFCYSRIAGELSDTFDVVGLNHPSLSGEPEAGPSSIEALADRHAQSLLEILPEHASAALGGWSMGGLLAHAVASRLQKANRAPNAIYMIDSYFYWPITEQRPRAEQELFLKFVADFAAQARPRGDLARLGRHAGSCAPIAELYAEIQREGIIPDDIPWQEFRRFFGVYLESTSALYAYTGQRIGVPTLLLVARDERRDHYQASTAHLQAVCSDLLIEEIEGIHYSVVSEHAPEVSRRIKAFAAKESTRRAS
jgi:amino acid adenylation domain-containing protein